MNARFWRTIKARLSDFSHLRHLSDMLHPPAHNAGRQDFRRLGEPLVRVHFSRIKWVGHSVSFPFFDLRTIDLRSKPYRLHTGNGAKVRITIEGSSANGYDPSWLRNAVDEPLEEADIERSTEE
jgi:hypothetical protein